MPLNVCLLQENNIFYVDFLSVTFPFFVGFQSRTLYNFHLFSSVNSQHNIKNCFCSILPNFISIFFSHISSFLCNCCCLQRHQPLISGNGLHQLHILVFFLAVLHVFYSAITMLLGRLKVCMALS